MTARERITEATLALVASDGFGGVSVAAVARGAGVTRQTVYSTMGSREQLLSTVLLGVAREALAGVEAQAHAQAGATAPEYAAEVLVLARAAVRESPVLTALLRPDFGNPLFDEGVMERARPVARQLMEPIRAKGRSQREDSNFDDAVELFTRVGLTVVLFGTEEIRSDEGLRRAARRWFAGALPAD